MHTTPNYIKLGGRPKYIPSTVKCKYYFISLWMCSRVSMGQDVPLSWDKSSTKNLRTNSRMSRDKTTIWFQNYVKKVKIYIFFKDCIFQTFFSLLSLGCPIILQDRMKRLSKCHPGPSRGIIKIPCPSLFHSRILSLSSCPVLPLSQDNKGTSVNRLLSCCPFVLGQWSDFSPFVPWCVQ